MNSETGERFIFVRGSGNRKPHFRRVRSAPPTEREELCRRNFAAVASSTFNTNTNTLHEIGERTKGKTAEQVYSELSGQLTPGVMETHTPQESEDQFKTALREVAEVLNAL